MLSIYTVERILLNFLVIVQTISTHNENNLFVSRNQIPYEWEELSNAKFHLYANLKNTSHLKYGIDNILKPRIVGSETHKAVRHFIIQSLREMGWWIELDTFKDTVPIFGELKFHNIIGTLNKNATRYLVLSCHYDSKYFSDFVFYGATDAAVPCAILLNIAKVLNKYLHKYRSSAVSLMFVFFDGEEAFEKWSSTDSLYGSRHLANKWEIQNFLDRIDLFILLDLIGAPDLLFYSFFYNTESWYWRLVKIEQRLLDSGYIGNRKYNGIAKVTPNVYFQQESLRMSYIEDDHTPFLDRNVPVLHIIPQPFPTFWHTEEDDHRIIDYESTEDLSLILRMFTMQYLLGT